MFGIDRGRCCLLDSNSLLSECGEICCDFEVNFLLVVLFSNMHVQ